MTEPTQNERPTLWLDAHITRRKVFHIVTNPDGTVRARSRTLTGVLDELDSEPEVTYNLALEDAETPAHVLTIKRL